MFDTTLLVVITIWVHQARMRCTALYINITYNFRGNCAILLNHVIACTYYEIIIYMYGETTYYIVDI